MPQLVQFMIYNMYIYLQCLIRFMLKLICSVCFSEVSSHALGSLSTRRVLILAKNYQQLWKPIYIHPWKRRNETNKHEVDGKWVSFSFRGDFQIPRESLRMYQYIHCTTKERFVEWFTMGSYFILMAKNWMEFSMNTNTQHRTWTLNCVSIKQEIGLCLGA